MMYLKESRLFNKRNCGVSGRTENHCKISNRGKKKRVKEKLGNKLLLLFHYLVSERSICFMPPLHIRPTVLTKNVLKYKITKSDAQISAVQLKKNII